MTSSTDPVFGMAVGDFRVGSCRGGDAKGAFVAVDCLGGSGARGWSWYLTFSRPVPMRGVMLDEGVTQASAVPGVTDWLRALEVEWAPSETVAARAHRALFFPAVADGEPPLPSRRGWGRARTFEALLELLSDAGLLSDDPHGASSQEEESLTEVLATDQARLFISRLSTALWRRGYSLALAPLSGGFCANTGDPWLEFADPPGV